MKRTFSVIIVIVFSFFVSNRSLSQPSIEWQNTIGGSGNDLLFSIQSTPDGGYILGGYSESNISGDKTENSNGGNDYWIVKIDAFGNILWQNTIGGSGNDQLTCLKLTSDGGYILGGYSISNISGDKTENSIGLFDYWIVKTDSMGNVQWQNTIGGNNLDWLISISQTSDGGYILGGFSNSGASGDKTENSNGQFDYWIVKTDSMGSIQWQNTIGGNGFDQLYSVHQTSDGGYILGGFSDSDISGDKAANSLGWNDYWIVKTDATGNIQWQRTIGGNSSDQLFSLQPTTDGGYILGGWSQSGMSGDKMENSIGLYDFWLVKVDAMGNLQWENTIGGSSNDYPFPLWQTSDGGFITGGYSASNISGDKTENSVGLDDYWIVKTSSTGNIEWQKTIGGSTADRLRSIMQTSDGGYILGGFSESNISGDKTENSNGQYDYWVVKLKPGTPLPVELISFNGVYSDNTVELSWATASEVNNDYFILERSADGIYFSPIATIDGNGNSNELIEYKFLDPLENLRLSEYSTLYYRLNQIDFDGRAEYHGPIAVRISDPNINVYPAITSGVISIGGRAHLIEAKVYSAMGKLVKTFPLQKYSSSLPGESITLDISSIPEGIYFIEVISDEQKFVQKIIKQ